MLRITVLVTADVLVSRGSSSKWSFKIKFKKFADTFSALILKRAFRLLFDKERIWGNKNTDFSQSNGIKKPVSINVGV